MDRSKRKREADPQPFPKQWWQWFFIYPTLGLALIGYLPSVAERVWTAVQQGSFPSLLSGNEDLRQFKIFSRNRACWSALDPEFKAVDVKGYQVGVTPCKETGDLWVRLTDLNAHDPDTATDYVWIDRAEFLRHKTSSTWLLSPVAGAFAAGSAAPREMAQLPVRLLCQYEHGEFLIRRFVLSNNACADESISNVTGKRIKMSPAPCTRCPESG
jgi:hypothetical protein